MTPTELAARVSEHFPDARVIEGSIVQFTRRVGSRPFAVYYLDCGVELPRSPEELRAYQDRVIGRQYFDGPTSLQWNNYLYFVASDDRLKSPDAVRIRDLLEQDRVYARKFLIGEGDLGHILEPDVVQAGPATETSALSIWNKRLAETGLGRAVWGDLDMPRRLALVEAATPPSRPTAAQTSSGTTTAPGQRLLDITLTAYRNYPLDRHFEFGTVNLIFGPNATGKTSLLEAIELFYCGRNKRSPNRKTSYDLSATLGDRTTERVTDARLAKELRQRNLSWYGQPEVLTNNLYSSFARFNFLDTDAAVHLAEAATHIDEELSKLLIGPDAAKTWENILKVNDAAKSRLKDLRDNERKLIQQIAEVDALVASLIDGSGADLMRKRLLDMLHKQNWRLPAPEDSDELAAKLIGPLSELVALARQSADLPLSPVVSRAALARLTKSLNASRDKVAADIDALSALEQRINVSTAAIGRAREASDILQRATRLVAAGIPARVTERNRLRQHVAALSDQLTGFDTAAIAAGPSQRPAGGVDANLALASAARLQTTSALAAVRAEHDRLKATRQRSANLAEELREIALQLLGETINESECPLCHTRFGAGELIAHINSELRAQIDRSDEELLVRLRQAEDAHRKAVADETGAVALVTFVKRAELPADTTMAQAVAAIDKAKSELSESTERLRAAEEGLKELERQGLRWSDLEAARIELVKRRFPVRDWSEVSVQTLASAILATTKDQDKILTDCVRDADKLKQQIAAVFGENVESARDARVSLAGLEQRSASAESLSSKLTVLDAQFRIPPNKPLGELAVEAETIRQVAVELQTAIQQEKDNNAIRVQSTSKRIELQQELDKITPRIKSLATANSVLQRLQRENSLHAAMQSAIQQNRAAIEEIFGQIHAPHEFSGLGDDITTLRRRDDTIANLTEISTGQRSALGLSMFLAQNMKLRFAPPVILIDDPIAHVDDLNCLAFLDYLREIALTKRRQIFFSTANDKLAAMFERKFDFLGAPEFRKIVLHRESTPNSPTH